MFAALEASWRRLIFAVVVGFFVIGIILSAFFAAAGCIDADANFGRVILIVVAQLLTGPGYLEMIGTPVEELSDSCIFLGFLTAAT